jgi:hypothetical protein
MTTEYVETPIGQASIDWYRAATATPGRRARFHAMLAFVTVEAHNYTRQDPPDDR